MENTEKNFSANKFALDYIKTEFDYVLLISINKSEVIHFISSKIKNDLFVESNNYYKILDSLLNYEFHPDDYDVLKEKVSLDNVVKKLENSDKYQIQFSYESTIFNMHVKKITFIYSDESKNEIYMACKDISDEARVYALEKHKLTTALNETMNANDAKMDFLARMSHDMRTPLNGIIGLTNLASEEKSINTIKKYLSEVNVSGKFLLGLINDILDMSKIENKKIQLHQECYYIEEFIEYLHAVISPLCSTKNQKFDINISNDIPKVIVCDKLRFNQIFFNLLSNASKYTPMEGVISISIRKYSDKKEENALLQFEIKDNGCGMSKEFLERIFEPFSREEKGSSAKTQGTGLGLSIVRSLVDLMHGTIKIESKEEKGTKVLVHLLLNTPSEDDLKENKSMIDESHIKEINEDDKTMNNSDLSILNKKRVLLAEDTDVNAFIVVKLLEKQGMLTEVAKNGQEAFERFMESEPKYFDVILMDIRMPIMDGIESTKSIRNLTRLDAKIIPIIAVTANAFEEDVRDCLECGMDAHIGKPIEPKQLYETLAYILQKK